jgi:microcystin-dependent protein
MMTPFAGSIQLFAFKYAPMGWAPCNGQLLAIANFTVLYTLLGTTYGGDGKTTFALPNLPPLSADGPAYYICIEGVLPPRG